ncbi:hypothetical protein GGR56DRAFT_214413 [Xylariaceae sp. FL0804]|nr:hypothetical protein GGR56DRAFT_214413 [Xylariaceae sp. FL0804]
MATMYATSSPVEAVAIPDVQDVQTHRLTMPTSSDDDMTGETPMASSLPSPRINLPPPPNPPFVFPAQSSPGSAPSSFSRATGRRPRPRSTIELPEQQPAFERVSDRPRRSPALPDFSFNPGASLSPDSAAGQPASPALPDFSFNPGASSASSTSFMSPPLSPHSPNASPSHLGHRRSGSEFVGGSLRSGESITLMSTSPTKSESGFASPTLAPVGSASNPRRGHAHRRSAAISSHDLSALLQPKSPNLPRGSSAPTSPSDFNDRPHGFPDIRDGKEIERSQSHPCLENNEVNTEEELSQPQLQPSPKQPSRTRVGFSDTLEFIPRPLSLVSTDTASTITGRPGHSVSGSISSIMSATNSTTTEREPSGLLGSPASATKKSSSRPSTAGAILERTPSLQVLGDASSSLRRRNSIPLLSDMPQTDTTAPAVPSPIKTPKRWSFFGLESLANGGSPTKAGPASPSLPEMSPKTLGPLGAPCDIPEASRMDSPLHVESKVVPKKKKKQKKVKTWAGSILTRKPKSHSQKPTARRRSQTPPLRRASREGVDSHLMGPSDFFSAPGFVGNSGDPLSSPGVARRASSPDEEDAHYQMIDLDAALGPFNTPSYRDPQWEEAQKSAGATPRRQLHSAAKMRGFSGPGGHYHRRAESAPEMPPFEGGMFGIHRFGSSSTMADVFEEEEEGEDDDEGDNSESEGSASDTRRSSAGEASDNEDVASTPTQDRELGLAISQADGPPSASVTRKGSATSLERPVEAMMRRDSSSSHLHEQTIAEESTAPSSVGSDIVLQTVPETSDPTACAPRRIVSSHDCGPADANTLILPAAPTGPVSPFSMSPTSSFPSPRSPISYDAHRISTAPSSITEDNNFQSLLLGEPGPEVVRLSVDVPSLTSSNSTMTRESTAAPAVRPRNMPFHDQRPASLTSMAFGRRRSSLASLSRLISSAHGERSKLSVEVPCDDDSDQKPKTSKSKRLSRKLQFWKPKSSNGS